MSGLDRRLLMRFGENEGAAMGFIGGNGAFGDPHMWHVDLDRGMSAAAAACPAAAASLSNEASFPIHCWQALCNLRNFRLALNKRCPLGLLAGPDEIDASEDGPDHGDSQGG